MNQLISSHINVIPVSPCWKFPKYLSCFQRTCIVAALLPDSRISGQCGLRDHQHYFPPSPLSAGSRLPLYRADFGFALRSFPSFEAVAFSPQNQFALKRRPERRNDRLTLGDVVLRLLRLELRVWLTSSSLADTGHGERAEEAPPFLRRIFLRLNAISTACVFSSSSSAASSLCHQH